MDDELLRTALKVAQSGSFAAVARDSGVDPSSISRQVAAVEAEIGLRIFDRTTRRLKLTEAGRVYLERVGPLLEGLTEAADTARDIMSEPSGLLRVTTSVAFGERWLIPRLTAFQRKFPKIELDLALSDGVTDLADTGTDLALRLGTRPETGAMVAARLFDTSYRVVAAPSYVAAHGKPHAPQDIARLDGLLFQLRAYRAAWRFRAHPSEQIIEALPRTSLTVSNALALRRAAILGMGIALLADWTVDEDIKSGALLDLFPDYTVSAGDFDTAVWIVYLSRDYMPARMRVFIDHLKSTP